MAAATDVVMAINIGIGMCGGILLGVAVGALIHWSIEDVVDQMVDANNIAVMVVATAMVDITVMATTTVLTGTSVDTMVDEDHALTIATIQWEVITVVADMGTTCLDDSHACLLTVVDHRFQAVQVVHTGISSVLLALRSPSQVVQRLISTTAT